MQSLPKKEREAKHNANDRIFRKKFSLPSEPSAEQKSTKSIIQKYNVFETKSQQTLNILNISKKTFSLTTSKKYIMIEKFKDRIKGFKNMLNEIKKNQNY